MGNLKENLMGGLKDPNNKHIPLSSSLCMPLFQNVWFDEIDKLSI